MEDEPNTFIRFMHSLFALIDRPVVFFREKIVVPNQKKYPWYHQQFRRVPTIETCDIEDIVCRIEADSQFKRDKMVDEEIVAILRQRYEDCAWENYEDKELCLDLHKTYEDAAEAYFIKYGDLGIKCDVVNAFMKQKHRMIWERRHGPVGSGMNEKFATV
ncbi:NADH dehydrogenase [ubiquinone] 1 beta subcomplex subunit 10 [Hylaeus volcanicus]|uniref:NADH dehydrogenase [ubiquinone] 1 beta subcomplex subunit 10 n=1 Tax=Hylaeus volcanicus TaxID=313075 RepID=UPI0023B7FBF8|nr:NADH dehydrogenase [ubiquinone] 1 beta subcomplex subunit 10 [Hylaeus volcanicus]